MKEVTSPIDFDCCELDGLSALKEFTSTEKWAENVEYSLYKVGAGYILQEVLPGYGDIFYYEYTSEPSEFHEVVSALVDSYKDSYKDEEENEGVENETSN